MTGQAGTPSPPGDCALVELQGIEIVLSTRRAQALNIDLFTQLGCDPASKKIGVVKSAHPVPRVLTGQRCRIKRSSCRNGPLSPTGHTPNNHSMDHIS
jgi:hypothetical protein